MSDAAPRTPVDGYLQRIADDGYCVIPQQFAAADITYALRRIDQLKDDAMAATTRDLPGMATDSPMLWNMQNKDPFFFRVFLDCAVLREIAGLLLNDPWYKNLPAGAPNYILRQFVARSSVDQLAMHIDSFIPYSGPHVISLQALFVLSGMDEDNGCSVVVPGSHQSVQWADPAAHPDATPVIANPGDLVVWDSRLWHGARANPSGRPRWTLTASFTRWWIKQAFRITDAMPAAIYDTLTDEERAMLGYCSIPFFDEREGIDGRRGYEALAEWRPKR